MNLATTHILPILTIGIGATLVVDLWTLFLKRIVKAPSFSYCLVGRWLLYMPAGTFTHRNITATPQKRAECAVGWTAHYAIGIAFAFLFIAAVPGSWLARPTLGPALLFGAVTVLFPFLLMQPSFGFGFAASKAPRPMQARLKSLLTHVVFGAGLYLSALGVSGVRA